MLKVNQLSGFGITGTRELVYLPAFTLNLNTNDTKDRNTIYTIVQKFNSNVISRTGESIRVRVTGDSVGNGLVSACYIGLSATSGNAWNFASAPSQILWRNGQTSLTLAPNEVLLSDPLDFTVTGGQSLSIAFQTSTPARFKSISTLGANYINYSKASVSEAGSTTKGTSYTATSGRVLFISQLLVA